MDLIKFILHPYFTDEETEAQRGCHVADITQLLNGRTTRCNNVLLINVYAKGNAMICVKAVFRIPARLDFFKHGHPFPLLEFRFLLPSA